MSRFLQEILYEMLADKEAFHTVANARHIYATRQKTMHALLLRQSLDVHTGDGLNLWIPVRDEPAALRLLAEQGIRVAAGKPFLPSLRISADATGAERGGPGAGRGRACQSRHPRHHRTAGSRQRTSGRRPGSGGGRNAEDFDESLVILHELRSYARRGAPRLYGVINGLLRMRNGLRRSQELDDLVDVLASSIGALTNPRTNCPHREKVAQEKPRCSRSTTASRRSSSYATWSNPSATSTASSR